MAGLPPLTRAALPAVRRLGPAAPPDESGIVHLGLGNFHRAHQAVYTALALRRQPGPWGIIGVAPRSRETVRALAAQDQLSTVLELAPSGVTARVPAVMTESLVAADRPGDVVRHLAAPGTRVITLTVTEKGYSYSPAAGGLDVTDPAVAADLRAAAPPRTVIGLLAAGLRRRAATHGAPVTVLSCDNLAGNGERTRRLVTEFLRLSAAGGGADAVAWLDSGAVTFPCTMVDRIVPATTAAHRELAARELGLADRVPVPAEPFSMWVLEDDFAAGRPAWEAGGAVFTGDVRGYELLKLRLLNGTHSLIAYLGLLAGRRFIAEAVRVPAIERAARAVMLAEYLPTVPVPAGVDPGEYARRLFERFGNTAIGHLAATVGSDGSLKLPVRVTEPVRFHASRGRVPRFIALTVAAYLRCAAAPGGYDARALGAISDPAMQRLAAFGVRYRETGELVEAVFTQGNVFDPELAGHREFTGAVAELLGVLARHGVAAAVAAAAGG